MTITYISDSLVEMFIQGKKLTLTRSFGMWRLQYDSRDFPSVELDADTQEDLGLMLKCIWCEFTMVGRVLSGKTEST